MLAAYKPLILLGFHRAFHDTRPKTKGNCKGQPPQFIDEGSQKGVAVASRQGLIEGQRRAPRAFAEPLRCAKGLSDGAGLIPGAGGVQFRVKCAGKPPGDKIRAICIEEDSGTQSRSAEDNGTHGFPPADSKPVVPGRDDQQDKACQQKKKQSKGIGGQNADSRQGDAAEDCQHQSGPAPPAAGIQPEGVDHRIVQGYAAGIISASVDPWGNGQGSQAHRQRSEIDASAMAPQAGIIQKISGQKGRAAQSKGEQGFGGLRLHVIGPPGCGHPDPEQHAGQRQQNGEGEQTPLGLGAVDAVQLHPHRHGIPHLLHSQLLGVGISRRGKGAALILQMARQLPGHHRPRPLPADLRRHRVQIGLNRLILRHSRGLLPAPD